MSTGQSPFVVFSDEESIYHMNLNGSDPHVVLTGLSNAAAVDYDYRSVGCHATRLCPHHKVPPTVCAGKATCTGQNYPPRLYGRQP